MARYWWECPKCREKVMFGYELATLFDKDDKEANFCSESGVPFYVMKCPSKTCDARWNFGISPMYENSKIKPLL